MGGGGPVSSMMVPGVLPPILPDCGLLYRKSSDRSWCAGPAEGASSPAVEGYGVEAQQRELLHQLLRAFVLNAELKS